MAQFNFLKVKEEIKRNLAEVFEFECRDPRLELITVMDIKLSKDGRYATVYVSPLNFEGEDAELLKLLKADAGYLRSQLAKRLHIKHTPELRFEIDDVADRAQRIEQILREDFPDQPDQTDDLDD